MELYVYAPKTRRERLREFASLYVDTVGGMLVICFFALASLVALLVGELPAWEDEMGVVRTIRRSR